MSIICNRAKERALVCLCIAYLKLDLFRELHSSSPETKCGFTTYAWICVEMGFNKGFPA